MAQKDTQTGLIAPKYKSWDCKVGATDSQKGETHIKTVEEVVYEAYPWKQLCWERKEKTTSVTFAHVHTNGGTELDDSSSSVDSQEWSEYANSVLKNGMESSTSPKTDQMEEDGLQFHAHFDHTHNRAVLVMKQGQVDW